MEWLSKLKHWDAYPKTLEDFRVRTFSGAAVSIISGIIILLLFLSELSYYMRTEVHPQLFVDTSRGEKLRINFDIIFPRLPCAFVTLDAMDIAGEHQIDIVHNIFKKRLGPDGIPLTISKQETLGDSDAKKASTVSNSTTTTTTDVAPNCGSCYGAESVTIKCCNSCEAVREAYRQKGWGFVNPDSIAQCVAEEWSKVIDQQRNEGCQLYGHLMVNKVGGNFHFAPGKSYQQSNMHVHDTAALSRSGAFNLTHQILRLSFGGEFPGITNPLDNVLKMATGTGMYQYFIKIVPTVYEALDRMPIVTNQFSVTEHFKSLDQGQGHGLPGVFFMYDLSPIMIKMTERKKSFAHFLTGVCAIIGGVFTVASIVDSFIYHSMRSLQKKIQLGKAH